MKRRCQYIWRRIQKKIVGLILLSVGIAIIAIIILPYSVWIALVGCFMIYIGYKLFCNY